MNTLKDRSILLAIVTVFLQILNIIHHNSYLEAIGIEPDFIVRSFEQTMYYSLNIILIPWSVLIVTLTLLIMSISLYVIVFRSFRIKRVLVKVRKKLTRRLGSKYVMTELDKKGTMLIDRIGIVIGVMIIVMFFIIFTDFKGKEKGIDFVKEINSLKYSSDELISISKSNSKILVVSCGIDNCAGINIDTKRVIYFKKDFIDVKALSSIKKY